MSTTPKPPAPSKWAMEAAREYASLQGAVPPDDILQCAAIIQRHHAAAQAETVALLGELLGAVTSRFAGDTSEPIAWSGSPDQNRRMYNAIEKARHHLAQLKEGAPLTNPSSREITQG